MDVREEFKMLENNGNIFEIMRGKRKTPPSFSNEYAEPIQVPFERSNRHSNTIIEDFTPLSIIYPFKENDVEQSKRPVFQCYDMGDGEVMYVPTPEPPAHLQTEQPTQLSADTPTVTVDEGSNKGKSPNVVGTKKKLGARKTVQPPQKLILSAESSGVKVADEEGEKSLKSPMDAKKKTVRTQLIMSAEPPSNVNDDDDDDEEGGKKQKSAKVGRKKMGARKTARKG